MTQPAVIKDFQKTVKSYYASQGRFDLPWRMPLADGSFDAYRILVSELMLQQTQVARVIPKYTAFLGRFPTVASLADAELADVLVAWSGLGYNRRAKYLYQAAQTIQQDFAGEFPLTVQSLTKLPGVGINTAGAVVAYAYDQPVIYVETNIRTVFLHHFFRDETGITEMQILEVVKSSLPAKNIREWYWALMDYGTNLKVNGIRNTSRSTAYSKQSSFAGSRRQVRGLILKLLVAGPSTVTLLRAAIADERLDAVLTELLQENLIRFDGEQYSL